MTSASSSESSAMRIVVMRPFWPNWRKGPVEPVAGSLLHELGRGQLQLHQPAVSCDIERHPATDEVPDDQPLEVADTFDRRPIKADDEVAGADTGSRRGASIEKLHDLESAAAAEGRGHRARKCPCSADDTEVRTAHASVTHQRAEDGTGRGVDRDGEPEADPGHCRVDPDDAPARVGERP